MTSAERSIIAQQQVIPDRCRNVQQTNSCKTSVSKVLTQGTAAEVLERARLSAAQAQQLEERLVLLQEEEKKTDKTDKQPWRSWSFNHGNEQKGQLTWDM